MYGPLTYRLRFHTALFKMYEEKIWIIILSLIDDFLEFSLRYLQIHLWQSRVDRFFHCINVCSTFPKYTSPSAYRTVTHDIPTKFTLNFSNRQVFCLKETDDNTLFTVGGIFYDGISIESFTGTNKRAIFPITLLNLHLTGLFNCSKIESILPLLHAIPMAGS